MEDCARSDRQGRYQGQKAVCVIDFNSYHHCLERFRRVLARNVVRLLRTTRCRHAIEHASYLILRHCALFDNHYELPKSESFPVRPHAQPAAGGHHRAGRGLGGRRRRPGALWHALLAGPQRHRSRSPCTRSRACRRDRRRGARISIRPSYIEAASASPSGMARQTQFAVVAAQEALADAGWTSKDLAGRATGRGHRLVDRQRRGNRRGTGPDRWTAGAAADQPGSDAPPMNMQAAPTAVAEMLGAGECRPRRASRTPAPPASMPSASPCDMIRCGPGGPDRSAGGSGRAALATSPRRSSPPPACARRRNDEPRARQPPVRPRT